jgi:hypothetical protein
LGITLAYEIDGMLCFTNEMRLLAIGQESANFRIPFLSTLPTPVSELTVTVDGALEGVKGQVTSTERGNEIVITVSPDTASPQGAPGRIALHDPKTGVSDSLNVILVKKDSVKVSPHTLRFRSTPDGDYVASGILHLDASESDSIKTENKAESAPSVFCEAYIESHRIEVSIRRVSDEVHRIKLQLPDAESPLWNDISNESKLMWNIVSGGKKRVLESSIQIQR